MIYFFHGFESSLPSQKVDILNRLGLETMGIPMNYNSPNPYSLIEKTILENLPSAIVGSSMGGYFALKIGTKYNIPLVLLNPAIVGRSITFDEPQDYGKYRPQIWALLGKNDDVIPPDENENELLKFGAVVFKDEHGHRTPDQEFKKLIQHIKKDLILAIKN